MRGKGSEKKIGGWAAWLLSFLRKEPRPRPSLTLLERINIAPRQSVALIEAEGHRFLVATSAEGAPSFHPLDGGDRENGRGPVPTPGRARVSW
jgi:flagellar biogenesis protein FliO